MRMQRRACVFFFHMCENVSSTLMVPGGIDVCVQEVIAEACVGGFRGDGYKFQAAGREDIDVSIFHLIDIFIVSFV